MNELTADKWKSFYQAKGRYSYPDENLVRLIKGDWADIPRRGRVLDAGFGTGASLAMMAECGYEAHGLEVTEVCCEQARALARALGVNVNVRVFETPRLPYEDGFFDIVVSWNAIYYWGNRTKVRQQVDEFHRVLRPGGVLLMSVIHPNNCVVGRLSEDLGDGAHRFEKGASYDNRKDMTIFYEPTSTGWRKLLAPFESVEEGMVEVDLFNPSRRSAWRLFLARK